jgi:hypothetical protein
MKEKGEGGGGGTFLGFPSHSRTPHKTLRRRSDKLRRLLYLLPPHNTIPPTLVRGDPRLVKRKGGMELCNYAGTRA